MPSGEEAHKALQGFLHIMGFDPGNVDGDFRTNSIAAYNEAREQYSFLPELSSNPSAESVTNALSSIDNALQTNVAFQRQYVEGVTSAEDTTQLQGALVAGGSWANRHLGDRISNAEAIAIDGERGILTERGTRNATTLTGVATMQSSLNLLTGSDLRSTGIYDDATNTVLRNYAEEKGIELTDNAQENFVTVQQYIRENEGETLRARVAETLNSDQDYSAPDERTRDAQIVMNGLAREGGSNTRTAPDARQTDSQITEEMSHTRNVITQESGVDLTVEEPALDEIVCIAPHVDRMYEITRNNVLDEMQPLLDQQANNPECAEAVLAYSEEARSYVLITKNPSGEGSSVYQISDRNVADISEDIANGSIAIDSSASTIIAERMHGNRSDTQAYTMDEIRSEFAENPNRYTHDTRESLLTTSVYLPSGQEATYQVDDLHDALNRLDSKNDWEGEENPYVIRDYIKDLREAAEDVREEREIRTIPQWQGEELTDENSVEIRLGEENVRVPSEIYARITDQMEESERGYSQGRDVSALRIDSDPLDLVAEGEVTDIVLGGQFDRALAATEPLDTVEVEVPAEELAAETQDPELETAVEGAEVIASTGASTGNPTVRTAGL